MAWVRGERWCVERMAWLMGERDALFMAGEERRKQVNKI
jgi:hypothetical protein